MWFALRLIGAIGLAAVVGIGSAYLMIGRLRGESTIQNGPWTTNLSAGGAVADQYTRAFVAVTGLLALNKDETIYFGAERDSTGEPLDGKCTYRIEGRDPDARWWSITLYGEDHFLIPNASNRYAISKSNVTRTPGGAFVIRLSTVEEPGNWIATSPDGFQITLRLYNPGARIKESPATAALPSIVKEACL